MRVRGEEAAAAKVGILEMQLVAGKVQKRSIQKADKLAWSNRDGSCTLAS